MCCSCKRTMGSKTCWRCGFIDCWKCFSSIYLGLDCLEKFVMIWVMCVISLFFSCYRCASMFE